MRHSASGIGERTPIARGARTSAGSGERTSGGATAHDGSVGSPGSATSAIPRWDASVIGELEHPAEIAPGYVLPWDPALPQRCGDLTVPADAGPGMRARIAAVEHPPWLRLAAVAVLDRQLYLPLDRSLLDAELAGARLGAARTLAPSDRTRQVLVERALAGARSAATGLVAYFERLAGHGRRLPPSLAASLDPVVRAYAELAGEVSEFDGRLAGVSEAWHGVCSLPSIEARGQPVVAPPTAVAPTTAGAALLDPRSVRARVLRLGPSPDTGEIVVDASSGSVVRVWVEAFPGLTAWSAGADIAVRLVEHRSGTARAYGVLGWTDAHSGMTGYEGFVSLPESLSISDVRVDVFEMPGDPVSAEHGALREVRRATLFQSAWRELVADVRLWGARAEPATRLCAVVQRITEDVPDAAPLWSGGPSRGHLVGLSEWGNGALADRLRGGNPDVPPPPGAEQVVAAVSGPGDLLAAEIAAAYDRSRPYD